MNDIDTMRAEVVALIEKGAGLREQIQALRTQQVEIQAAINERVTKLNLLAKLGGLTDDDKAALQQILATEAIASGEKMHTPNA